MIPVLSNNFKTKVGGIFSSNQAYRKEAGVMVPLWSSTSSFDPLTINNLIGWYDASDLSTLYSFNNMEGNTQPVNTGDHVRRWNNKASSSNNAIAYLNDRPFILVNNSQNGKPSIFDSSTFVNYFEIGISFWVNYTMIVAAKQRSNGAHRIINSGTHNSLISISRASNNVHLKGTDVRGAPLAPINTPGVVTFRVGGGLAENVVLRFNALNQTVANSSRTTNVDWGIVTFGGSIIEKANADLFEILLFDRPLLLTEIIDIETYLIEKWGL